MDDAADVGLVDAHPEGDGGRNHLHLVVEERLVRFLSKNFDRADQNQFFEKKNKKKLPLRCIQYLPTDMILIKSKWVCR